MIDLEKLRKIYDDAGDPYDHGGDHDRGIQAVADAVRKESDLNAKRYQWLNNKDNFLIHIDEKRLLLKCGEPLDRWIDAQLAAIDKTTRAQAIREGVSQFTEYNSGYWGCRNEEMRHTAGLQAVADAVREECAKICEKVTHEFPFSSPVISRRCAQAIRKGVSQTTSE